MKKALFFAFMDFLPVTMTGQRWAVLSVFMNQSMPNRPSLPPPPPIFDWGLFLYSREFDPKWSPPSQALTFISKCWSALQAKGFCNFFCMKRCIQRSLLLYSLICWSIWEPLKKPIKCWLCGMNNFEDITISSWLWVNSPWALWSIYYIIKRLNSSVTHFKVLPWRQHIRAQERYMKWF